MTSFWDTFQLGVFILQNSLKMLFCAPLQGKPGPRPKAALLLLGGSPIVSASPPSSDEQPFERLPCPGAPQGPRWVSFSQLPRGSR